MSRHPTGRSLGDSSVPRRILARAFLGLCLGLFPVGASAGPTFVVNSTADVPAGPNTTDGICETATGNGVCTLRAAIMEANGAVDSVVRVPAGLYALTRPSTGDGVPENGDLDVIAPMKIEGDGPSVSLVDGNDIARVFRVRLQPQYATNQVEIRGLTIQNGSDPSAQGGGGINSSSRLLLENVLVTSNVAGVGGGIFASNSLTFRQSAMVRNSALLSGASWGGGVFLDAGTSRIEDSRIEGNRACVGAGVMVNSNATLEVERTGILGNGDFDCMGRPVLGASGIYSMGRIVVFNSVFHDNFRFSNVGGSAVQVADGTAELFHATITNNDPRSLHSGVAAQDFSLSRSILTSNRAPVCFGSLASGDYNLLAAPGSCSFFSGQTAHNVFASGLDTLVFSGGFSPDVSSAFTVAQEAVPIASCFDLLGAPLTTDFRGHRRKGPSCDIGAHDALAVYAPTPLLGVNLVRNGGESGRELGLAGSVANPPDVDLFQAPYWAQTGRMVQILYGAPGGYPTPGNAPPGSGHKFFAGGEDAFVIGKQSFDISAIAAQIDAGTLPFRVSGAFGGYQTNDDSARLEARFSNASGGFISQFTLGGFSAADRGNQTRLIRAERSGNVPIGTRFIELTLYFERFDGLANDGYADAISVVLPEPGTAAGLAAALSSLAGLTRRRMRRTGRLGGTCGA